jgi:hypothetical protein
MRNETKKKIVQCEASTRLYNKKIVCRAVININERARLRNEHTIHVYMGKDN